MYGQGVPVWVAPTADARDTWIATMRHIAPEGRCLVLSANQFATRGDYPPDYPLHDAPCTTTTARRTACFAAVLGHRLAVGDVLAGPAFGEGTILRAELDLDRIIEATTRAP